MMLDSSEKLTPGEVFARWRRMPEMRYLVEACYYDEDVAAASQRFHASEEFQAVLALAQKHGVHAGRVLDLGGGNGMAGLAWQQAGYDAVLVEPDEDAVVGYGAVLPQLMEKKATLDISHAIGEHLPFRGTSFDIVYVRQVFHHIPNLPLVCKEIYRVLRPGGILIATREHVISQPEDLEVFYRNHPLHQYTGGENAYPLSHYLDAIRAAGFKRVDHFGPYQSVMNFYPTTITELSAANKKLLARVFGRPAGNFLGTLPVVQTLLNNLRSRRDQRPGRLYSFIAVR
jgi:SAM-dependent methyltransferase